jgi:hypothetical protein
MTSLLATYIIKGADNYTAHENSILSGRFHNDPYADVRKPRMALEEGIAESRIHAWYQRAREMEALRLKVLCPDKLKIIFFGNFLCCNFVLKKCFIPIARRRMASVTGWWSLVYFSVITNLIIL